MAKKNNNSEFFRDWTTKKLKDEARCYYDTIYVHQCYGTSDLRMYGGVTEELENRGVEICNEINFN